MKNVIIKKSTMDFLQKLSVNNNRDWFNARKELYMGAKLNVEEFIDALILKMNSHDRIDTPSGRKSLYRIYNDVRFAKDKKPYTCKFSGHLKRSKPMFRGGYYFRIQPGESRVACGFAYPNPEDLKRIRMDIADNYGEWYKLMKLKGIKNYFVKMIGDRVATVPRGFDKDHLAIDLLRYKQFWFIHSFTDKEVLHPDFLKNVDKTFKAIRPIFNYMSYVLTTDLNGESVI